jgi:O-antigen/teichoic acid export membrane protein
MKMDKPMPDFKRNIFFVYTVNAANGILGVIIIPLSVSYLGISGYGLLSIYWVLVSYMSLADIGIGKNLLRLLASERQSIARITHLQAAFGLYLIFSVLLLLSLPALLFFIPKYIFPVSQENILSLRLIISFAVIDYIR